MGAKNKSVAFIIFFNVCTFSYVYLYSIISISLFNCII